MPILTPFTAILTLTGFLPTNSYHSVTQCPVIVFDAVKASTRLTASTSAPTVAIITVESFTYKIVLPWQVYYLCICIPISISRMETFYLSHISYVLSCFTSSPVIMLFYLSAQFTRIHTLPYILLHLCLHRCALLPGFLIYPPYLSCFRSFVVMFQTMHVDTVQSITGWQESASQ